MRALRFGLLGAAALGLLLGGCSSDPCDGQSGTCVSARVEGAVTGLDQLRVSVAQLSAEMLTPTTPSPFSLPAKVAILLPATVTSPATITIDGTANGQGVATSGPQSVAFTAGSHASFTFTLVAGRVSGDGGVGDQGVNGDGAVTDMGFIPTPGHVSASPTTLNFPSTPRGQQSAPQAITIYNRTGMAVSTVSPDLAGTTGMGGGDFMPTGVSPSSCALTGDGVMIPANVDCTVQLVFAPQTSGPHSSNMPLTFNNGDSVSLSFQGTATMAWAAETVPTASAVDTTLSGVWATSGLAVIAGKFFATLSNPVAYLSTAPGQWQSANGGLGGTGNLTTVGGYDAMHVWAGGPQATFYALNPNNTSWTAEGVPDGGTSQAIEGIWMASPSEGWAVNGDVVLGYGGIWEISFRPLDFFGNPAFPTAISGFGPGQFAVVGTNGYVALAGGTPIALSPFNSQSSASLRGVWAVPGSNSDIYAVGLAATPGGPGTILHCSGAPFICKPETSPVNGDLVAISGRSAGGKLDLYAVGPLGNQVLHSTGNGTWTAEPVPNNGAMNAVSVAPDGEVFAVGEKGEVNHLY